MKTTFVYVSNAQDGDISTYRMRESGELQPGLRAKAAAMVMPMAVNRERGLLYAVSRSEARTVHVYSIDRSTGALTRFSTSPLVESFAYITLDRTGRFLLAASYGGSMISVNAVDGDGRVVTEPLQVIPVGRNAHAIRVDESNRFVYVPTLGSDAIFKFDFDARTGALASNTPAVCLMKPMTGPRHLCTAGDNRFVYVLSEFLATVTTFALDGSTGLLAEVSTATGLPPDTSLVPGAPRGNITGPQGVSPRDTANDIWAADIHMTPNGKFMYISERTSSTIAAFGVDCAIGKLTYLSSTSTERQPRGFNIDAKGRFMVVTGEKSDTISVYAIEQGSGALKFLNKYPTGKGANWVEIVSFE